MEAMASTLFFSSSFLSPPLTLSTPFFSNPNPPFIGWPCMVSLPNLPHTNMTCHALLMNSAKIGTSVSDCCPFLLSIGVLSMLTGSFFSFSPSVARWNGSLELRTSRNSIFGSTLSECMKLQKAKFPNYNVPVIVPTLIKAIKDHGG